MFFLQVKLDFDSKEAALRFFKSIKPELEEEYLRSKMKITQNKEKLEVFVSAQDKTALRASLNSLLKPLVLFESIEKLCE
jgi:tRNA threonylcarbamoyladenosine modification (KEOPS) complex  Pcc1 subunit